MRTGVFTVLILVGLGQCANAQTTPQMGEPVPGGASSAATSLSQYDSLDLRTLNPSISIPVVKKKGSLPFSYSLKLLPALSVVRYDENQPGLSTQYGLLNNTYMAVPDPYAEDTLQGSLDGMQFGSALSPIPFGYTAKYPCGTGNNVTWLMGGFTFVDSSGVNHVFNKVVSSNNLLMTLPYIDTADCFASSIVTATTDGSGYYAKIAISTQVLGATIDVYDKHGNDLHAVEFANGNGPAILPEWCHLYPVTLTDSNGHTITESPEWNPSCSTTNAAPPLSLENYTFTDTLGTTALTLTGSNGNSIYTYSDSSGNPQTVQVDRTSYALSTRSCSH